MSTKKQMFVDFFTGIPDEQWCVGIDWSGEKRCAINHVQKSMPLELPVLFYLRRPKVLRDAGSEPESIMAINDGKDPRYTQPTPKARILAWLNDLSDN